MDFQLKRDDALTLETVVVLLCSRLLITFTDRMELGCRAAVYIVCLDLHTKTGHLQSYIIGALTLGYQKITELSRGK